ncbi:MAG: hypothetical protein M3Y13_08350, partial [Armatimonadota bacterium]|nr:hypothetical protein [Armatimonadota bacterium]
MSQPAYHLPVLTTKVVNTNTSARVVAKLPVSLRLFVGALALYGSTRTHLNTFDAVAYANQIGLCAQTGKLGSLFHPHHLLFNALGFGLWRLAQAYGYAGGPLVVLQSLNGVLGALGLVLFYGLLRRLLPEESRLALPVALGLGGSFGFWICAADGRVNMASTVLLIAAFARLCRLLRGATLKMAAQVGALAGAAVLFHQSAGLFLLVGLAGVWIAGTRARGRRLLAYGGAWAATVCLPYALVSIFCLHLHSWSGFHHWANSYAERGWWWDFHLRHNVRLDIYALRHAVFVEPLNRAAFSLTPDSPLAAQMACAGILAVLWLAYLTVLAGWMAALAALALALPRLRHSRDGRVVVISLLWIGLYAAFFTVWCPGYFVFWVPILIPLGLLLALAGARLEVRCGARFRRPAGAWVALFILLNVSCSIVPQMMPAVGLSQRVARDIRGHTQPRDLIVVAGAGDAAQCEVDVPYFANRPILSMHALLTNAPTFADAQATLRDRIARAQKAGRTVYVMEEIWGDVGTVAGLEKRTADVTGSGLRSLFAVYPRTLAWTGPRGPVWRLARLPSDVQTRQRLHQNASSVWPGVGKGRAAQPTST